MSLIDILVAHTDVGVRVIPNTQGGKLRHETYGGYAQRSVQCPTVAGAMVTDLVSLVAVLAASYGITISVVVLVTGWRWFRIRTGSRSGRGRRVPPEGATGQALGGVR